MLHLADNSSYIPFGQSGHDPLYKIRTFLDPLTKKFQCLYSPTQNLTIDEAICPFRGRIRFRIYIKGKPHKYGIKIYHICEANSGYTCNINIYTGKHPSQEEGYNSIPNLVERLASHLFNRGHIIYCDRWFSSPHLFNYLWEKNTMAVGTVKTNRKGLPKKSFSKKLKKGEEMHLFKGSLMAMKWRHTRDVWMISTVHDHQMVEVMGRPGLSQAPIFKPQVVLDYNKNKIGVDRSDQMLSYYSFDRRTMKWDFHISICEALCSEANQDILDAQPSSGEQSDPLIRRHFIRRIKVEGKTYAQRRCKVCAEKGRVTTGKQARKDTAYESDTHLGASTVHRLWRRWLEQGNVAIYRNVGATRVTSARVDRRILRQAVAAPQATCTAILQHVQDTLDHSISTRTISRRLVANGLHSCRPLRRLPLTPPNRRQRLEWCRARSTWMTEWHRVVFSDESRFCLSSDSRRVRVWRRRGERSNPAAIVERPTVRQRGIMVWGAIAYDSRSPLLRIQGTMTAQRYVDDVLRPVTLPYLQGVPNALYQ
ncbi:PGBD5 [Cordylochernes scorpioides]|uniref:PGBD5 n=1 Tax=Cordylochernes scorpioides TaxID=51811 RepID=A0ABY6KBQ2_9ARAC|nr:PGBD5 [Cordylochernes scorpioides]